MPTGLNRPIFAVGVCASAHLLCAAARSPMLNASFTATRLEANAEAQTLTVGWADGHTSVYSYEGLRRACPCAECRGGHGAMAEPVDPIVFQIPSLMTYEVTALEPAGHYALRIVWGDGHSSGLFRWEKLRGYCPCAACSEVSASS